MKTLGFCLIKLLFWSHSWVGSPKRVPFWITGMVVYTVHALPFTYQHCQNTDRISNSNFEHNDLSCCWQTRASHCITGTCLQTTNVVAHCDKLTTELRDESGHFSATSPTVNLLRLHFAFPLGVTSSFYAEIFGISKLESLGYRVALFAWSYI